MVTLRQTTKNSLNLHRLARQAQCYKMQFAKWDKCEVPHVDLKKKQPSPVWDKEDVV